MPQPARSPWNALSKACLALKDELDALLFEHIVATRAERCSPSARILAMMVCARDADGAGLSDEQLRDELITLITAGHETTATAIAWGVELSCTGPAS